MASVAYKKLHSSSEFKRIARHCDQSMRLQDGHRNQDINKALTNKNTQLPDRGYGVVCKMYSEKLAALDRMEGANKRADRVTAFSLEVPAPLNMRDQDKPKWFDEVYTLICTQYDHRNVMQFYVHYDEVHEYLHADSSKPLVSREHAHCLVIPEHDGKLNGKWFSSRVNMIKLNNAIHEMTLMKFGLEFMDGSKKGSVKRVEQLKHESEARKYEEIIKKKEQKIAELDERIKGFGIALEHFDEVLQLGIERYRELHPEPDTVDDGKDGGNNGGNNWADEV